MQIETKRFLCGTIILATITCFITGCEKEEVIFKPGVNSPYAEKINFKDPNKWTIDKDKLVYSNPNNQWGYALIETDQTDYQLDAEITIDTNAESQAKAGGCQTKQVGLVFRKGGHKEGLFYTLYRCIDGTGIEQWAAIADLPGVKRFAGKDSVAALSMDNIESKHHLRAVVKKDLANFYVDGQLVCIIDISGLDGRQAGLCVVNYAAINSFTIRKLKNSDKIYQQRPAKSELLQSIYPGKEDPKITIERAGKVIDDAIQKASPGIEGMEEMAHYTYCAWVGSNTRKKHFVAYPAFHHAIILNALLKYREYTKDDKYLKAAYQLADWEISNSTPSDWALPNMAYSTVTNGKMGGSADADTIMVDKSGMMGQAYLSLYTISKEQKYLDAAVKIAQSLLKAQLPEGRWQNRVSPKDDKVLQDYTSNQIFNIMLMDRLYEITGDKKYSQSSKMALMWLLENPVKTGKWSGFYEDVGPDSVSIGNWDAILTARYLVAHRKDNPAYLEIAKQLNDWIFTTFAIKAKNAWPLICEQSLCMSPMNCHTLNYANLLVDLYKATGEKRYRDAAISVTRAGFAISGDKDGWGWYSLKVSPLYFGIDLVRELNLK